MSHFAPLISLKKDPNHFKFWCMLLPLPLPIVQMILYYFSFRPEGGEPVDHHTVAGGRWMILLLLEASGWWRYYDGRWTVHLEPPTATVSSVSTAWCLLMLHRCQWLQRSSTVPTIIDSPDLRRRSSAQRLDNTRANCPEHTALQLSWHAARQQLSELWL